MEFFEEPINEQKVDVIIDKYKDSMELVHVLQDVQHEFGYIPRRAVEIIGSRTGVFPSRIFGIITFYSQFTLLPKGENVLQLCMGTACHVRGCDAVAAEVGKKLGLNGPGTTVDKKMTVQNVACVGACAKAPVVMVNEDVYGKVAPDEVGGILDRYLS